MLTFFSESSLSSDLLATALTTSFQVFNFFVFRILPLHRSFEQSTSLWRKQCLFLSSLIQWYFDANGTHSTMKKNTYAIALNWGSCRRITVHGNSERCCHTEKRIIHTEWTTPSRGSNATHKLHTRCTTARSIRTTRIRWCANIIDRATIVEINQQVDTRTWRMSNITCRARCRC